MTLYKIYVTSIINPDNFQAQIGNEESFQFFQQLEENCRIHAESVKDKDSEDREGIVVDIESLEEGQWVLGYSQQLGKWTRAQVNMTTDEEADVNFVDYQITELLDEDHLLAPVPEWVYETRPMVYKCKLSGIKPLTKNWISRATNFLNKKILFKVLDVEVLTPDAKPPKAIEVDILIEIKNGFKSVSDLIKEEGLAMTVTPEKQEAPLAQKLEEPATETRNSPAVPTFDVTQLLMKPVPREPVKRTEDDHKPGIEEMLFMKGVGAENYQQFMDTKIASGQPFQDEASGFSQINIAEQLREMKQANEKAVKGRRTRPKAPHSPARRERRRASDKRPGIGRGAPPPNSYSPTPEIAMQFDLSPIHPSVRKNSASPSTRNMKGRGESPRACGDSPRHDSPKHLQQNRETGKNVTPDRALCVNLKDDRLKNEYEWQLDQFQFKLKQIVERYNDSRMTLNEASGSLKRLFRPAKQSLSEFGGKGELELGLEFLCVKAIEEKHEYRRSTIKLLEGFKDEEKFNLTMSELVWDLQTKYVKVKRTRSHLDDKYVEGYCRLLAQLYIAAQRWEDSSSINTCVLNTLEKWRNGVTGREGFSRPNDPSKSHWELYADCLTYFITEDGPVLESYLQEEMQHLFNMLEQRESNRDLPSSVRDKLHNLIVTRNGGTWVKPEEEIMLDMMDTLQFTRKVQAAGDCKLAVKTENPAQETNETRKPQAIRPVQFDGDGSVVRKSDHPKPAIQDGADQQEAIYVGNGESIDIEVRRKGRIQIYEQALKTGGGEHEKDLCKQTSPSSPLTIHRIAKSLLDKAVQTDATEASPSTCSSCSTRSSRKQDKYHRARFMLFDLELEEFFPAFMENGIRDTVLDLDFPEVKELLKECGVKAGQILEIKAYLKKQQNDLTQSRSDQSSSPSVYSDTVDSLAMLNQPILPQTTITTNHPPVTMEMVKPPPGFTRQSINSNNLNEIKTLFSPQDFEASNSISGYQHGARNVSNRNMFNTKDPQKESNLHTEDFHRNISHTESVSSDKNTIANAATRLPQVSNSSNTYETDKNYERMLSKENNNTFEDVTIPKDFRRKHSNNNLLDLDSDRAVNFDERKNSDFEQRKSRDLVVKQHSHEAQGSINNEVVEPTSPDSNIRKNHPRTKYNLTGIKSIVGDWLGPKATKSPSEEHLPSPTTETHDSFGSRSPDTFQSYSEVIQPRDNNNKPYSEDHNSMSWRSRVQKSPPLQKLDTNRSPNMSITHSGDKSSLKDVISPSSYLPPSPRSDPVSLEDFPSLSEAKILEEGSSVDRNHRAFQSGPREASYTERYRAAMQIPDEKIVNERILSFGNQVPMCSFCGNRGQHLSHECPDKHKNMFY